MELHAQLNLLQNSGISAYMHALAQSQMVDSSENACNFLSHVINLHDGATLSLQ
ncbi:MAG: hypothetical protein ACHQAX_07935 [Gammaproteobacteria bacterium]